MTIITPGYKYVAANFENSANGQTIQFIEKTAAPEEVLRVWSQSAPGGMPTNLVTVNDGTTNEELLKVLIDRISFLQQKFPSRENAIVITKLEESLMWLEKRTNERKARGVEGQHVK